MIWCFLILFTSHLAMSAKDLLAEVQCEEDPAGYIIPDPLHCDRYLDCDPVTGRSIKICPVGQGVHLQSGVCEEKKRVDCGSRQIWRKQEKTNKPRKVLTRGGPRLINSVSADSRSPVSADSRSPVSADSRSPVSADSRSLLPVPAANHHVGKVFSRGGSNSLSPVSADPTDPLAGVICDMSEEGYVVHDPEQCDRYAYCSPHGVKKYKLCPDGLALSLAKYECDYIHKADCSGRTKLQPTKGKGHCVRENGRFALPAEISCSQYVDCREGKYHIQGCAVGAVFDEDLGCVHPDQTERAGCSADEKYDFQCPTFGLRQRFGDHDRLPHPKDCKLYFACLSNGRPRLNSCEEPLVFNPRSGFCDDQDNVPGCEGYYVEDEKDIAARDKLTEEIREQLLKELGLSSRSRVARSATDKAVDARSELAAPAKVVVKHPQEVVKKVNRSDNDVEPYKESRLGLKLPPKSRVVRGIDKDSTVKMDDTHAHVPVKHPQLVIRKVTHSVPAHVPEKHPQPVIRKVTHSVPAGKQGEK